MQKEIEDRAPVLESLELDLTDSGWIKVNGPLWQPVARRRWRNGQDFKWRMRERENSNEAMCGSSGIVIFQGFQQYIELLKIIRGRERTEEDGARYSPENTSSAERKIKCARKKKLR
jgi:hypothetical protein